MATKDLTDNLTAADLLEMKTKLDDELQRLLLARSTVNQESEVSDIEQLSHRISELQDLLLEESNIKSRNELVLRRLQLGKTLCDVLFGDTKDYGDALCVKRSLEELELVTQIMRIHKETSEMQEKLESQRLANLKLKNENMELMKKLQDDKEELHTVSAEVARNKDYKQLKSELEVKTMSLDINKSIIQHLVAGMSEDWSQNPKLLDILLKCGQTQHS